MTEPVFQDKFIAFLDIVGFKTKVEEVERGGNLRLSELLEYCAKLAQPGHTQGIATLGPMICPESRYQSRNLNYRVTQISDCAVISAEVSPAGVINLLYHASACVTGLLTKGVMARGYISRGSVYHEDDQVIGTGYQEAWRNEREVKAFRLPLDDTAPPFVEVDPIVVNYIQDETDRCVRDIFQRLSRQDTNGITAVFPFNWLSNLAGGNIFNEELCRESLAASRKWIGEFLEKLDSHAPPSDSGASQKARYYREILREQLEFCDNIEKQLELLKQPAVKIFHR